MQILVLEVLKLKPTAANSSIQKFHIRMARSDPSMRDSGQHAHQTMVAHFCRTYWKLAPHIATVSQNGWVTMVATWNISNWPPAFCMGIQTSMVLQVERFGATD